MIGGTLYLVGKNYKTNDYAEFVMPCAFCKRMIINAGIKEVVLRNDKTNYTVVDVEDFVNNDESLEGRAF